MTTTQVPSTIYIAFGNTLYDGIKGTQSIRLWTADAEQAALFEQETGMKANEYRLAGAGNAPLYDPQDVAFSGVKDSLTPRWYCIARDGVATLCVDAVDARETAAHANAMYPRQAPHRAVQLVAAGQA